MSHLLQMRGLKLTLVPVKQTYSNVASFTDAWIETLILISASSFEWSHLLQMRGLKLLKAILYLIPLCRIFYRCVD